MNSPTLSDIHNVALLNFGGIGDEILFSPVIRELRQHLPHAHLVLFLEDRSSAVRTLLPDVDEIFEVNVQETPRPLLFFKLSNRLRGRHFDLVISCGSSPFIAPMLYASNTPLRFGFESGWSGRQFLTGAAPLNLSCYASDMYFSLATTCIKHLKGDAYSPAARVTPLLKEPAENDINWARETLKKYNGLTKVLIHPGVSQVSVTKGMVKSWSPDSWAILIQRMIDQHADVDVFLVGGPDDESMITGIMAKIPKGLARFTNLYGKTRNLDQLSALIDQTDLLVSVDSAPMHIAVGMNTPLIALFGNTDPKRLLPISPKFVAIKHENTINGSTYLNIDVATVQEAVKKSLNAMSD